VPYRPTARTEARRTAARERIVRAATELVAHGGYREAQVVAVAQRAEVATGTVYRHFPQKDALMGELVASKFRTFADNAEIALTVADPWEAFSGLIRQNAETCARDVGIQQALGREPGAWAVALPELERLNGLANELIARGQAAGVLRADLVVADIPMLMCGLSATQAVPDYDWRRHLEMLLDAMRPPTR